MEVSIAMEVTALCQGVMLIPAVMTELIISDKNLTFAEDDIIINIKL